jgi:hypothetical protein
MRMVMRTSGKKTFGVFEPPKHKEEAAIKEELQKEAENESNEPKPNENNNYSEHASNKISEIESKKNEDQQESQGGHIASDVT